MAFTRYPAASLKVVEFLSSGSWTAPAGVYAVDVLCVGGGGGSGAYNLSAVANYQCSGAGGGGGVVRRTVSVTPGTSYTVTVGAGGSAGTAGVGAGIGAGGVGGDSSFGSLLTAFGGGGGMAFDSTGAQVNGTGRATGGGEAGGGTAVPQFSGGGGGALKDNSVPLYSQTQAGFFNRMANATQGSLGRLYQSGNANYIHATMGGFGVDGYGGGGGGAYVWAASIYSAGWAQDGGGAGANRQTSGTTVGTAGTANTGGGGGGSVTNTTASTVAGAAGGTGYVKVVYTA